MRYKTGFYLQYLEMNSYEIPPCQYKIKIYSNFLWNCGLKTEMKINSKQPVVRLEDTLVLNDYEWLSSGQEPLPNFIWETFLIYWMIIFPYNFITTEGRDIWLDFLTFSN